MLRRMQTRISAALNTFAAGDVVIVTTPDHTHYDIAVAAIQRRMPRARRQTHC